MSSTWFEILSAAPHGFCGLVHISEEVSPSGTVSAYQYDRNNRLIQAKQTAPHQEEPAERVTEYTYDPAGNLLRAQAGDGKEVMTAVSYEYDALNRVTAVISPVGGRTVYTYDKKTGKISSITDAAGNQRTFRYNILGELTEETDIHGNTTRYEYNALGRPATITDGAGRTTRHTYLPGGRLEKTEYSDGTYISYEYDSIGRLKKKTDQSGRSITYTYDCMGRILTVSGSAGQEKSYTYDAMGNVTSATDADGNVTKYAYTLNGRLKEVTDALGNKTEYAYDKADRLIYICQHGQAGEADRTTAYERDAFGQVVCIRDASGGEEHFRYDALGRMTEKTDREGLVTAYTYTPDGRPESILYGDGRSAQMEYTPLRQLAKVKDWLGETKIERDRCGNPVSITDHNGRTVRYEWGSMGQREGMIYPDGTKISWNYDSLLRPVQMNRTAAGRDPLWTQYQYDGQGRLSEKRTSGGYITRWQYDETGLLGELSHTDASGILDRFQYTYDAAGNKTAIRKERRGFPEESGSYQYAYDGLHRLTGVEKDGKPLRSYQYDTFGNRTVMEDCTRGIMTVSEYDALNHLIRQEISKDAFPEDTIQKTYTYDKRGNLTGEYQDGDLLHGYAFNSMNRLEKAWDSEGTEAEYFYNALGQRTARSTAEETEEYLLDLTKPYHNLLERHKGKHRQTFYWDMNVSAMEDENRTLQYYLQDELGSPLRVLYRSGSGAAYGYDEFGTDLYDPEKKPGAGRQYSRQGEHQPFGFIGYRYDDISGTYFAQAREYQPGEGRFTAEDILRGRNTIPKTLNRYGYCWNNPLIFFDLNGQSPKKAKKETDDDDDDDWLNPPATPDPPAENPTVTFCVDAPDPGTRNAIYDRDVGHTFLTVDYGNGDVYSFGFYPEKLTRTGIIFQKSIKGVIKNDKGHEYNEYLTYEITQEQADQLLEFAQNYDEKYNVVTNNCTTFVVDALKSIGINVPTTEKTWTLPDNIEEMIGCNEFIIRLLGGYDIQGYSPADAAADIAEYKANCDLN